MNAHTSHISAPGWIQRWVEKGPAWIQPFPSNLHFWRKSIFYTSSHVKCAGINLIEVLSSCQNLDLEYLCNILFIFFTKIDLKIWVWYSNISKIYNYNLFRLNQSQSQSSFTPNRITREMLAIHILAKHGYVATLIYIQFSIWCCVNAMLMVWLGFRQNISWWR